MTERSKKPDLARKVAAQNKLIGLLWDNLTPEAKMQMVVIPDAELADTLHDSLTASARISSDPEEVRGRINSMFRGPKLEDLTTGRIIERGPATEVEISPEDALSLLAMQRRLRRQLGE